MFAIQNRAEDTKPCATIMIILPDMAHLENKESPAIIKLMWETEE